MGSASPAQREPLSASDREGVEAAVCQLRASVVEPSSTAELADAIATLGRAWQRPPLGAERWAAVSAAASVAPEMLAWGLSEAARTWRTPDLLALVADELGSVAALDGLPVGTQGGRPALTTVVLASTVPPAGLQAALLVALAGSAVLLRPAAALRPFVSEMLGDVSARVPLIGHRIRVVSSDSASDAETRRLARAADAVVVLGGDDAVASWRRAAVRPSQVVGYGHRISLAMLGASALERLLSDETSLAESIALDVAAWDQRGCLSPRALWVEGPPRRAALAAERIVAALTRLEIDLPMGPLDTAARATRQAWVRARLFDHQRFSSPGGAVVLVGEPAARVDLSPGMRVLPVRPVSGLDEMVQRASTLRPWLQCIGEAGLERGLLDEGLASSGLNRVCGLGRMQRPPLRWRHDGIGSIAPLLAAMMP